MMKNIYKTSLRCALSMAVVCMSAISCSDWVETELVEQDIKSPLTEEQRKDYLENLLRYKNEDHKIAMMSFANLEREPMVRAERLEFVPDSIDYVVLQNPDNLSQSTIEDMSKIKSVYGTKTLYNISQVEFEKQIIEYNMNAVLESIDPMDEAAQVEYIRTHTAEMLTLFSKYNYDGLTVTYSGRSTLSLTGNEAALAENKARQDAFFSQISEWRAANPEAVFVFEGTPQYVWSENMSLVNSADYIVMRSFNDKFEFKYETGTSDIDYTIGTAVRAAEGGAFPTDRFIIGVAAPIHGADDYEVGYMRVNNVYYESSNVVASWVCQPSSAYTRAGIMVDNASELYYGAEQTPYRGLRRAIALMNI